MINDGLEHWTRLACDGTQVTNEDHSMISSSWVYDEVGDYLQYPHETITLSVEEFDLFTVALSESLKSASLSKFLQEVDDAVTKAESEDALWFSHEEVKALLNNKNNKNNIEESCIDTTWVQRRR